MKIDYNPFYIRASEYIDSDDRFIKLFSPEILDIFDENTIWNSVNIIRSSPGGGKTSILNVFTPSILSRIQALNKHDSKELYKALRSLQVFNDKGPTIIGSLLSFSNEYSSLEELELTNLQKIRIFNALLNSRIILSVLKSICYIKQLEFPDDLIKITIHNSKNIHIPQGVPFGENGLEYYNWACKLEENICKEIDSVFPINTEILVGFDELFSLKLLNPNNIKVSNIQLSEKILVMFDDIHNLSTNQRDKILRNIIEMRPPVNIWIAERLQALTMKELYSEGSIIGRDYTVIDLENYWRKSKKSFEDFAKSVADKRISSVTSGHYNSFEGFLQNTFDDSINKIINDALQKTELKFKNSFYKNEIHQNWIKLKENFDGNNFDKLVGWKSLEILLNRERNDQISLGFSDIDEDELTKQEGSDVKKAARLFLNRELGVPFYYGFSLMCQLASNNIEQFLHISGVLFEDIISASLFKLLKNNKKVELSTQRQEELVRKISKSDWDNMIYRIPEYERIKNLLESIGQKCESITYLKNAPISPGINGIAILMSERKYLADIIINKPNDPYYKLAQCLAICISYNLLECKLNRKCKGKEWMVLYLNKLFCVKYNLPLDGGNFREFNLSELVSWLENETQNNKLWN